MDTIHVQFSSGLEILCCFFEYIFYVEYLNLLVHYKHTFLYFTEHSYSCCKSLSGRTISGLFLVVFSLEMGSHLHVFFICQAILDCILSSCTVRFWSLLYYYDGCWWICFNRQLTWWDENCTLLGGSANLGSVSPLATGMKWHMPHPYRHARAHMCLSISQRLGQGLGMETGFPLSGFLISRITSYFPKTLNSIFRQAACSFGVLVTT